MKTLLLLPKSSEKRGRGKGILGKIGDLARIPSKSLYASVVAWTQ